MLWCCIKTRGVNKLGSWASCLSANRPSMGFAERSRSKKPKKHRKFIPNSSPPVTVNVEGHARWKHGPRGKVQDKRHRAGTCL